MTTWKQPTHCPLCGEKAQNVDEIDPELIECPEHGVLEVEVTDK